MERTARLKSAAVSDREARRRQILDRARDVFSRRGYHQAKIDDIVAAAGVARGTFYLYFHDKRAIFEELVQRFWQKIVMSIARIDVERPVEPQVLAQVRRILDVFLDDPAMAKIMLSDAAGLDAEFDRRLLAFASDAAKLLEDALHDGQVRGLVKEGNPSVLGFFLVGGVKEVLLQIVRSGVPIDREATTRDIYAILARGILVENPKAKAKAPAVAQAQEAPPARKKKASPRATR
jgi:AcrR family transcriptional regulator